MEKKKDDGGSIGFLLSIVFTIVMCKYFLFPMAVVFGIGGLGKAIMAVLFCIMSFGQIQYNYEKAEVMHKANKKLDS